jgi:hypothetical protein
VISHDRAQELISARMDAPLTPAEHRELQGHLASCAACRVFVTQTDDIVHELQAMTRLAPSPMVSRAVMSAIRTDSSGWSWLRHAMQTLSSPGMAVASSLALVVALASALILALNAPGSGRNQERGAVSQGTIAAMNPAPLPTEPPTETPPPTMTSLVAPTAAAKSAAPTATKPAGRQVQLAARNDATKTPTPRPTATVVPIEAVSASNQPGADSPAIVPSAGDQTVNDQPTEAPALAMAPDQTGDTSASTDLAQSAAPEVDEAQPAENTDATDTGAAVDAAPSDSTGDVATEPDNSGNSGQKSGGKKGGEKSAPDAAAAEPEPTWPIGPVPAEAIAALKGAGGVPNIMLPPTPPGPYDPSMPDQSFLPVTPTPVGEGTPTPATESDVPQLADNWSDDLGVTALAPDNTAVTEAPDDSNVDSGKAKENGKHDKESKDGKSHEEQQAAWGAAPMGWSSQPIDVEGQVALQQTADEPVAPQQTTDYPVEDPAASGETTDPAGTGEATDPAQAGEATDAAATGEPADATATDAPPEGTESELQIDPATGMQIDPATGFLIDPTTGYLIDQADGRIIDPRTGYQVHLGTGLLIDPATGALLDPNTLEVVVPPGFFSDQPNYVPGSGDMRGQIEDVVQSTYDNASIKLEPPTDGPVQPVGDITVPTESGDAREIS